MSSLPHDSSINGLREKEIERLKALKKPPLNYDGNDRGVLLSDKIKHYSTVFDLITPFDPDSLRPAGYDLRVGSNYSISGEQHALNEGMHLEIGPYQVAVIETYETLNIPKFLIGRWNIRVKHAYNGLLWVGGAQVDPGFRGRLCCPIYNLSTKPVRLAFKEQLAMIDFVTTSHFETGCQEFQWQSRKMLVFSNYPLVSSGIEEKVTEFQEEINDSHAKTTRAIEDVKKETDRSLRDVQTRIDTFVVLTFTVVAVLFAGLGIVATKSAEASLVSASVSLVSLATVALYFALRPYYLVSRLISSRATQSRNGGSLPPSLEAFPALLHVRWWEVVFAILLILASLGSDACSLYAAHQGARRAENAQIVNNEALQNARSEKVELEEEIKQLHHQYDSKTADLENQIEILRRTKKDK